MIEPWKKMLCNSPECLSQVNQDTIKDYTMLPDIDNEVMTQFTCRHCGKVQTWGVTVRAVTKVLYEKYFKNADLDEQD